MSLLQGTEIVAPQFNYKPFMMNGPMYKWVRIQLSNTNSNSLTLSTTSTTEAHFKLPANDVFNLSKSKLAYQIALPASATGAGYKTAMIADCYPFCGNVSLETGNGIQAVNLQEASKFSKITTKCNTKLNDYLAKDSSEVCYPNYGYVTTDFVTKNYLLNGTNLLDAPDVPYLENQYYQATADENAQTFDKCITLGELKHTLFEVDKDITIGTNDLYAKFTIGETTKWTFECKASDGTGVINAPLPTMANVYLFLAVQTNETIIKEVRNMYNNGGIKLLFDYPFCTKQSVSASTNQNVVVTYSSANGKRLKRIYHTVFNNTEQKSGIIECANVDGAKVKTYNTYLDATKLQPYVIDNQAVSTSPDSLSAWRWNARFCRNSPILNRALYNKNWFHCDSFESTDMEKEGQLPVDKDNVVDGLLMDKNMNYTFESTTPNTAFIHFNIAIFQRELLINKDGIQSV
jgi:hypothetical protein